MNTINPDEKIRAELNGTGLFLESAVYNLLSKNPNYKVFREEPYSGYTSVGFEGVIDILLAVLLQQQGRIVCIAIECKKADVNQKKWVVDKQRTPGEDAYSFDYYQAGVDNFTFSKNIFFPSLGYQGMQHFDRGIQTFEFNDTTGRLSRVSGREERPYYAMKQANEAISSFSDERRERIYNITGTNIRQYDIVYIPLVITTAELYLLDYDPEEIDLTAGSIDTTKVKLQPKDWIHYEFPLPYSLRTRAQGGLGPVKRPSFIVKANKCEEFLKNLISDCKTYIL